MRENRCFEKMNNNNLNTVELFYILVTTELSRNPLMFPLFTTIVLKCYTLDPGQCYLYITC
ncbi:hypothetical protein HanPSC8_Chr02g0047891 [Helianthus annuus]|nr:hypothetical protein HanPSC8_Chr02g0047891 [Helianthus annuus]